MGKQNVPIATFIDSILSSRDYLALAICTLQLVELLLIKAPNVYKPALRPEGVLHEIEEFKAEGSKPDAAMEEPRTEGSSPVPEPVSERDESPRPYLSGAEEGTTDPVFEQLRGLMGTLRDPGAAEAELKDALKDIAAMFGTIKKLQESLTRIENFEVVTVSPGAEASRRNSPSMLACQLRLRIVAEEGTDAP
ncbi:hypothetical protein RSAG8_12321, partial [Rhizoctonia solani AG-8 WAC10335]